MLMDANDQTGDRIDGEDEGTMGKHGRNELDDNGRLLLNFATDNRLAISEHLLRHTEGRGMAHIEWCVGD